MIKQLRPTLVILTLMTFLLGGVYPSAVWVMGRIFFPFQARGSLLYAKGQIIGSALIGQPFSSDAYFWPRPSASPKGPYQFLAASASNKSLTDPTFLPLLQTRTQQWLDMHEQKTPVPQELVTASASGLDPDISPEGALYQASRIAKVRHTDIALIVDLIQKQTKGRTLGFLGERRVNVLELNLALDRITGPAKP